MPGLPGAKGHRGFAGSDGGKGIFHFKNETFLAAFLNFSLLIKSKR